MNMLTARLIETEDGDQIVVFPPGFEIDAEEVEIQRRGDGVVLGLLHPTSEPATSA